MVARISVLLNQEFGVRKINAIIRRQKTSYCQLPRSWSHSMIRFIASISITLFGNVVTGQADSTVFYSTICPSRIRMIREQTAAASGLCVIIMIV